MRFVSLLPASAETIFDSQAWIAQSTKRKATREQSPSFTQIPYVLAGASFVHDFVGSLHRAIVIVKRPRELHVNVRRQVLRHDLLKKQRWQNLAVLRAAAIGSQHNT